MLTATLFTGQEAPVQTIQIAPEALRFLGVMDGWELLFDIGRGLVLFVFESKLSGVKNLIVANDAAFCGVALPGKSGRMYSEIELRQAAATMIINRKEN